MQSPLHELDHLKSPAEHQRPLLNSTQQSTERLITQSHISDSAEVAPRKLQSRWSFMSWKLQLLSWLGSSCFFAATIIVLRVFDGKPLPDLRIGLTPNAIVGLLATFTELLLVVPVNSAFGQLKWLRAMRAGPMDDFRAMDDASRGPWGSLMLLVRRVGGPTASFGAIITILAISISTFTQQALRYDDIYPYSETSLLPIAQYINGTGMAPLDNGWVTEGLDPEMITAPYVAFFSAAKTNFLPKASCQTGNCTWESYQTLAICNTCENLTSKLNRTKEHINQRYADKKYTTQFDTNYYMLPNTGFGLFGTQLNDVITRAAMLNITTSYKLNVAYRTSTTAFSNNGSQLISVLAIGPSPGTIPEQPDANLTMNNMTGSLFAPPVAYECLLQFCIRTNHAQFINATLFETTLSTWVDQSRRQPLSTDKSGFVLKPPGSAAAFRITNSALLTMQLWLSTMLVGNATVMPSANYWRSLGMPTTSQLTTQAIYLAMNRSETGFPDLMDNLAASLSLNLRNIPYQPAPVRGKAFSSTSHAVVTWPWLILPALELVGSLVFLVTVILQSKKADLPPWVNNALAYLFHGLNGRPLRADVVLSQDAMEREAKGLMMEFRPRSGGGRLVLVDKSVG